MMFIFCAFLVGMWVGRVSHEWLNEHGLPPKDF
jgi:hypothetical protein